MAKKDNDNASWLRPIPEDFANDGMSSKKRWIMTGITAVVFIGFGVLIWLSYTAESENVGPVPVIRADNSVIKKKPIEPGGKEIPFQDKEVFDRVDNLPGEEESVIASSAEIPLKRPVAEPVVEEESVEEPVEEVVQDTPPAAPVPVAAPPVAGEYMVQIGAIADRAKADVLWNDAKAKNSTALADLQPIIVRVDLGERGILYRVRGGMIATRTAADNICTTLKNNNHGCMVVTN